MSKQFNYDDRTNEPVKPSNKSNDVTFIPAGCEIRQALLILSDDCRIDGRFFGTIIANSKIIIGENAVVKGNVICESANIYGIMEGNIVTGEMLSFMSSAVYKGEVKVNRLCVEDGAQFQGSCQMISKEDFAKLSHEFNEKASKQYPPISVDIDDEKSEQVKVEFTAVDSQKAI